MPPAPLLVRRGLSLARFEELVRLREAAAQAYTRAYDRLHPTRTEYYWEGLPPTVDAAVCAEEGRCGDAAYDMYVPVVAHTHTHTTRPVLCSWRRRYIDFCRQRMGMGA